MTLKSIFASANVQHAAVRNLTGFKHHMSHSRTPGLYFPVMRSKHQNTGIGRSRKLTKCEYHLIFFWTIVLWWSKSFPAVIILSVNSVLSQSFKFCLWYISKSYPKCTFMNRKRLLPEFRLQWERRSCWPQESMPSFRATSIRAGRFFVARGSTFIASKVCPQCY
jgi:hypothetical protein